MPTPKYLELEHGFWPSTLKQVLGSGDQNWQQTAGKVVVAAVGVGSFTLTSQVETQGAIIYLAVTLFGTFLSYFSCMSWYRHSEINPAIKDYYSWGEVAMGKFGRYALILCQVGYYSFIGVAYAKLMASQIGSFFNFVGIENITEGTDNKVWAKRIMRFMYTVVFMLFDLLDRGGSWLNLSNIGVVGVIVSWFGIYAKVIYDWTKEAPAEAPRELALWYTNGTVFKDAQSQIEAAFATIGKCFGAYAFTGLMPDWAGKMSTLSNLPKALRLGHLVIVVVYLLPVWIAYVEKETKVLKLFEANNLDNIEKSFGWACNVGVIVNVLVSFALVVNTPSSLTTKLLGNITGSAAIDQTAPMWQKYAVRAFFLLGIFLVDHFWDANFDKCYLVVSSIFVPVSMVILPFMFDYHVKKKAGLTRGVISWWTTGLKKQTISFVIYTTGLVVGAGCCYFGPKSAFSVPKNQFVF